MALRRPNRAAKESVSDALIEVAASLSDAQTAEELFNLLSNGLAEERILCALFTQVADTEMRAERATLPIAREAWGRPLRLPRLAAVLTRERPVLLNEIASVLSEPGDSRRELLAGRIEGPFVLAAVRAGPGGQGVLCLASSRIEERDLAAVWGLALQLGSALRRINAAPVVVERTTNGALPKAESEDQSLFHELTRRLSYSLSGAEVVRTGLEVLAPMLRFHVASAVTCDGRADATTVYSARELLASTANAAAGDALDAFLRLTGGKHRKCEHPAHQTALLAMDAPSSAGDGRLQSTLDAPLVNEGEVVGLLRVGAVERNAFDASQERTFYTVATQLSFALERIVAQQRAGRAQLASLAESLSDGIVLVDPAFRVTSLNSAARDLLAAFSKEEPAEGTMLTGTPLAELAQEALSTGQPTALRELPPVERRHLVAMAAPLAGSPEGSAAVVIVRDVTEERLMQERLLQSEKMVSVGQLVSGVAHELNNPLTGIMGFAQLLLARELDEKTRQDVETIHEEADRAAKIVQNLLSFARRRRAEKELVNLNVLLDRVLELRSYELRVKNIDVELDLDPDLPETMVDANQIQQVFFNISINAEQAMLSAKDHGTLTVRTRAEQGVIRLTFHDDGPGMSPETLRRIFDPFFTTKDTGEGTGLGLTITYGIIDEHGGRIWAESQPGRGTTFIIELPIVQGAQQPAGPAEQEPSANVTGRSILVVDDEESIQRLLGSILQMDGHRVDVARNGKDALERLARNRYDLVITDIKMPDMDGRELYQRLLDVDPALAAHTVFITGDTVSPDTRDFLQNVRNPCLAKPFRVREVRETISQMLGE